MQSPNDDAIESLINDPLYNIREDGSIWTLRTKYGKPSNIWRKAASSQKKGYLFFVYGPKIGRRTLRLHRIIYRKFIGPLVPGLVINHIDGNPLNNSIDNLEQVTQAQNVLHALKLAR